MTDTERAALDRIMLAGQTRAWRTLRDAIRERDELRARVADTKQTKEKE